MTIPVYSGTVPNPVQSQPEFDSNTQEFIDYMAALAPALNDFAETISSVDTTSTSISSVAIGTGTKNFTVETGKSYFVGMSLKIANTATNYMVGDVISYNSGNGALSVNVVAISGTGTYSSWTLTVAVSGVIDTAQIANGAVTEDKIGNNAVNLTTKVIGALPVANGGTGRNTLTSNNLISGNGTSQVNLIAPGTSGNVLTSNGTTWSSQSLSANLSSSLGANGYQTLPGGLIVQWGTITTPGTSPTTVSFPITFPNTCCSVVATTVADNGDSMIYIKPATINASSFQVTSYGVWSSIITPEGMTWFAIGY
jgi:hypothetical protein